MASVHWEKYGRKCYLKHRAERNAKNSANLAKARAERAVFVGPVRKECRKLGHVYDGARALQCPTCQKKTDLAYIRRFRTNNPERNRELARASYERRDKAALARQAVAWAKANPKRKCEHRRKNEHIRRAQRLSLPHEEIDAIVVWERDGGRCHICGDTVSFYTMELDHVHPLSRGGHHTYANVKASHHDCNNWKNGRLMEELDHALCG